MGFVALQHDWLCSFAIVTMFCAQVPPVGHGPAGLQIGHLQDALHELRDSVKMSLEEATSEREQLEVQANAQAQVDRALYEVCPSCALNPKPYPPSSPTPLQCLGQREAWVDCELLHGPALQRRAASGTEAPVGRLMDWFFLMPYGIVLPFYEVWCLALCLHSTLQPVYVCNWTCCLSAVLLSVVR